MRDGISPWIVRHLTETHALFPVNDAMNMLTDTLSSLLKVQPLQVHFLQGQPMQPRFMQVQLRDQAKLVQQWLLSGMCPSHQGYTSNVDVPKVVETTRRKRQGSRRFF